MKNIVRCATFVSLVSLLTACASTPSTATDDGVKKVAAQDCEVEQPRIGSNMTHRKCVPVAPSAPAPATAQ